jgi:hypothetical protein
VLFVLSSDRDVMLLDKFVSRRAGVGLKPPAVTPDCSLRTATLARRKETLLLNQHPPPPFHPIPCDIFTQMGAVFGTLCRLLTHQLFNSDLAALYVRNVQGEYKLSENFDTP